MGSIKTLDQGQITKSPETRVLSGERADSGQFRASAQGFTEMTELWCENCLQVWETELKQNSQRPALTASTQVTAVGIMGEIKRGLFRLCNRLDTGQPGESSGATRMSHSHEEWRNKSSKLISQFLNAHRAHVLQCVSWQSLLGPPYSSCGPLRSHHLSGISAVCCCLLTTGPVSSHCAASSRKAGIGWLVPLHP